MLWVSLMSVPALKHFLNVHPPSPLGHFLTNCVGAIVLLSQMTPESPSIPR